MKKDKLLLELDKVKNKFVSLGYNEINLLTSETFEEHQLGFRVDPKGNNLTGDNDGDWKEEWYVIGLDNNLGDPIFIDLEDNGIYTAMHGMEEWEPSKIAGSLKDLSRIIDKLVELSKNRENPVKLDNNPVSDYESSEFERFLETIGDYVDQNYWLNFIN